MKELWRKTAKLFREHPILWLPYVVAEPLAICLWQLRGMAETGLFNWFMKGHSVLGGDLVPPDLGQGAQTRAVMANIPLGFGTEFVNVCIFVVALLVTARMVNAIGRQQRPDVRAALAEIAPQWKRILWFSLKFLIAFLVVTAAISYPPIKLSNAAHHPEIAASMFFIPIEVLLVIGCVSWLLIPAAIRLLQAPEVGPITAEDRRRGTIFAILAVAVATALGELFQRAESVMTFTSHTESTVAYLVTALLVNAPDVLLFIALSLLALKDACNNSIQGCNEAVDLPSE